MEIKNEPLVFTGTIVEVGARQEFGSNGFAKREVLICADPNAQYPRFLQVVLTTGRSEDRTTLITEADKDNVVKVTAFVETRKWTSQKTRKSGYTTEAVVWKVEWPEGRGKVVPPPAEPDGGLTQGDFEDIAF